MVKILGHRILVKVFDITEADDTFKNARASGIIIAESDELTREQNAVDRGTVIQVGATAYEDFGGVPWVQVGDEVLFARYSGKKIVDPYTKEEFTAMNDEDVVAVITKEEKE
jgi:co-chaperonin GroES (HSP10)